MRDRANSTHSSDNHDAGIVGDVLNIEVVHALREASGAWVGSGCSAADSRKRRSSTRYFTRLPVGLIDLTSWRPRDRTSARLSRMITRN